MSTAVRSLIVLIIALWLELIASIRRSHLVHEVLILASVKHGLSHLGLLDVASFGSEAADFGLVEHVVFLDAGEDLLDARVVG